MESLRWTSLGGLEEIGRNCMFFEYKNEIIVVDLGLQFPEEDTPGIDYIIPNISYLKERKRNVKAVILTHGHYDHIGAVPYLMEDLGNPPIYTGFFTKEIVQKRQEEFTNVPKLNFKIVKNGDEIKLSKYFEIKFFEVVHSIPDTFGFVLKTPFGKMLNFSDFKLQADKNNPLKSLQRFKNIIQDNYRVMFLDSTDAEESGYSIPSEVVKENLKKIIKEAPGRVIVSTFASLLDRIRDVLEICEELNKKIIISGRTMEMNFKIAQRMGYLKPRENTIISKKELKRFPEQKIVILATGAQGEPRASLVKIANDEDRLIKIKTSDTFVFSSSVIPGNERAIQNLKDELVKKAYRVYCVKELDIHSGGHAPSEELKIVLKNFKYEYLIPYYAYYFMRAATKRLAVEQKVISEKNVILPLNGQILEINKEKVEITKEKIPAYYVMVDGLGIGDVEEVVLRDRKVLSEEGMVVIIATLSRNSGRLLKNPDIISRGFIYLRENKKLLEEIRAKIKSLLARFPKHRSLDSEYFKALLRDQIGLFLYRRTKRRPMILPVVIQV